MPHTEHQVSGFRKVLLSVVVVALVGATAFAAWWYLSPQSGPQYVPAPMTVAAQRAEQLEWRSRLRGVGDLEAVQGIDLTSEVSGVITAITFQPGQQVEKGNRIIQLSAVIDRAELAALEAQEKLARLRFERQKALAQRDISSAATLDEATAELQRLRAEIDAQQEAIAQKIIKAPFSGRLGIRRVSLGQYVEAGQPLVTLQNLDTLYANFTLPEQAYPRVAEGQTLTIRVASYPEQHFAGQITAVNPEIDASTRNFTVQGTVPNPDRLLRPGMFAEVTVQLGETRQVVALPVSAITYNPYGDAVFVLTPAPDRSPDRAELSMDADPESPQVFVPTRLFVQTGDTRNAMIEIREGIKPGDMVVTAGQLKLKDNARVVIDNAAETKGIPVASPARGNL